MLLVGNRVEGGETSRSQEPGVYLAECKSQIEEHKGEHGGEVVELRNAGIATMLRKETLDSMEYPPHGWNKVFFF